MELNLKGKTFIVTGGTKGIGLATVLALIDEGAKVLVNYHEDTKAANEVLKILETRLPDPDFSIYRADVSVPQNVLRMIDFVKDRFGTFDGIVNNAGIISDHKFECMDYEDWDTVLKTNLYGPFHCITYGLPTLIKQGSGSIVNVSSVVGLFGNYGQVNYAASKAGLIGLTKALAKETAKHNVRVNAIAPGFVDSRMTEKIPEDVKKKIMAKIPVGRFAYASEIANIVCFLLSDVSTYINGHVLVADGGGFN